MSLPSVFQYVTKIAYSAGAAFECVRNKCKVVQ
jgi:hypothetical protein